jgi:hypothetical protein
VVPRLTSALAAVALVAAGATGARGAPGAKATPGDAAGPTPAAPATPGAPPADAPEALGPEEALTQKIAVWRFDALGIEPELVARLESLFRMELDRLAKAPLPSRRDIERAVSADQRDCTGEERCLAAIGKKLGVDVVVTGSVGAMGDNYVLNIKAVDAATATQLRRISTEPLRGSPDELIDAVRVAAYRLLAPTQIHGGVLVLTDLVGAEVSLDDKVVGKTPLPGPVAKLALGNHRLRVAAQGYAPFDAPVEVRFQKTTRVVARLVSTPDIITGPAVPTTKVRDPWYGRTWVWLAVGAGAILVGGLVGHQLGTYTTITCPGDALCK